MTLSNSSGSIGFTYSAADHTFDFLAQGETLTVTYDVTVGGVTKQAIITITGTNDTPVITSGAQSGAVTEDVDLSANENAETHHQSGTITFTDVDLSDIETSSITNTQVNATLANGYTLTTAQQSALVNAFGIAAATHSSVDGTGGIAWHYDIADSALDFLGANDVVQLTYTVQVDDGNGGIKTQDVTITVHGTEDAPVITSGAQSGAVTEDVDLSANENAETHHQSGTITFTDVDLSDIETSSIYQHAGERDAGQRLHADDGAADRAGQRLRHRRGDAFERRRHRRGSPGTTTSPTVRSTSSAPTTWCN